MTSNNPPRRRRGFVALLLLSTLFVTSRKVDEYAAAPQEEKRCPPLFPESAAPPPALPAVSAAVPGAELPWEQRGGTINDASCLNETFVYGIVRVTSVEEIRSALHFAAEQKLKVSIAAIRHSMGGQAFAKNAVVLDMTGFNQMSLDEESMILTVQSGATWHDIQNFLHPRYAVKAMQSTDIFSVGGSISVNAHGMDHQVGALGNTIRAMRVMLPDGSIQRVSRSENADLFNLVVGGYGLFGIILEVELEVTENVVYASERQIIDYQAFPALFEEELAPNQKLGLMYAHLSTSPNSLLREMLLYTYEEVDMAEPVIPPLTEGASTEVRRFVLNFSKRGSIPMRLKWFMEKNLEPLVESCTVNRNQAMKDGEACLVSRNEPMHDSVPYLRNRLPNDTDILQEYFIPREQFVPFVDGLREIIIDNKTVLLNASVRVVHPEENFLNYAPTEMFSVVLYINQGTRAEDNERMGATTRQIIDLATELGGTFFLPYQLHYTPEQLQRAYPTIGAFFEAKRRYDPQLLLTNTFYNRFAGAVE